MAKIICGPERDVFVRPTLRFGQTDQITVAAHRLMNRSGLAESLALGSH